MTTESSNRPDPRVSGKKLVFMMFAFGTLATGTLWFYWDLHLQPFMPLQEALAGEFVESSPRVDGGQRKSHKGTPRILRVVMRVPFDPNSSAADVQTSIEERIHRTLELAEDYSTIEEYDVLELHLYQEQQEKMISQKTFEKEIIHTRETSP